MASAIGLAITLVFLVPAVLFIITAGIAYWLLQWAIVIAIAGYLLGIPYAIGFRLVKGRWPQY